MLRILDIDLDFFLADCCPLAEKGRRPALAGHEPWTEDAVRNFLEEQCGLRKERPVPGRVFTTHDEALCFWQRLMKAGKLAAPFSVTHIDAHSDLAIGAPGPRFILENVLSRRPDKRADIEAYYQAKQLDEANYLLFALAFRWIGRLENVRNPKSRPDIPEQIVIRDENGEYSRLKLLSQISALFEKINGSEPEIPFIVYHDYRKFYSDGNYAFASLAQSPRYAPEAADRLLGVISEYFCGIEE